MNLAIRRSLARAAPAAALLLTLAACSGSAPDAAPAATPSAPGQQVPAAPTPPATSSSAAERSTPMDIQVTLDVHLVGATLNESPAARDFAALLPLTLDLEDFHGTERVADLPRRLDITDAPDPAAAKVGDIAYYAPWGNLALFYEDGPAASADLLVLGHLDVGSEQLGGADRITIEAAL